MNANFLYNWYATLGPIGYFPCSGTFATLFAVVILRWFPSSSSYHYAILFGLLYCVAHFCIQKILVEYINDDPSEIVIDELIGALVTFYGIPLTPLWLVLGFILFRFFDITKPGPVGWSERLPGAYGILLDDVVAGLLSNIILRVLLYYGT